MDFMKVLDQTVREIKREVNIKVLKVPEIEQKVLDATSNEPWGPHGSALAEMAQSTKKFSECQLIMTALWSRLGDGGRTWRHVYKALAVIEYLVAHGSERALDDIIEHTFQISSLTGFEYLEPNGKDVGINVRKKAETITNLLSDENKIAELRNKAAANRDKYFGLSSSGITYKSSSATTGYGSSSSFSSGDRYGGSAKREGEMFKDSYKDGDSYGDDEFSKGRSNRGVAPESEGSSVKKGSTGYGRSRGQDASSSSASSSSAKVDQSNDDYGAVPSQNSHAPDDLDDDDDFNPRGTSCTGTAAANVNQVDLFGDFMDAPTTVAPEESTATSNSTSNDLFADAAFVSAPHVEASPQTQANVYLFSSQPALPSGSSTVDFFSVPEPGSQTETKPPLPPNMEQISSAAFDPFASMPLNSFDGSDTFGAFTSHTNRGSTESNPKSLNENSHDDVNQKPSTESQPTPKKDTFQVKSGIWADSLSRGLIDLNISAPKKLNLADIGIVGGLSDGSDEKEKRPLPSFYMGSAMTTGSTVSRPGFNYSTGATTGDDFFSSLDQQQRYGSFKK